MTACGGFAVLAQGDQVLTECIKDYLDLFRCAGAPVL